MSSEDHGQGVASSDTVIHTPIRRNSPYISPSALELFEQGISFPLHSRLKADLDHTHEQDEGHGRHPEVLPDLPRHHETNFTSAPFARKRDKPQILPGSQGEHSFLGKDMRPAEEPGELPDMMPRGILEHTSGRCADQEEQIPATMTGIQDHGERRGMNEKMTLGGYTKMARQISQMHRAVWPTMVTTGTSQNEIVPERAMPEFGLGTQDRRRVVMHWPPPNLPNSLTQHKHDNPPRALRQVAAADIEVPGPQAVEATATSFQSRQRTSTGSPLIGRLLIPNRRVPRTAGRQYFQKEPTAATTIIKEENKDCWYLTLKKLLPAKEDLDTIVNMLAKEETKPPIESACIPITTTTGSGRNLSRSSPRLQVDGTADAVVVPVTRRFNHAACRLPTLTPGEDNCASSPPTHKSNTLPKSDHEAEIPKGDITSVSQLEPTRRRTGHLWRTTVVRREPVSVEKSPDGSRIPSGSHMCTSTSPNSQSPFSQPANGANQLQESKLNSALAQGAAQVALLDRELVAGPAEITAPMDGRRSSTDDLSRSAEAGDGGFGYLFRARGSRKVENKRPIVLARELIMLVMGTCIRLLQGYWSIIAPCFDGNSPIRRRLERQRTTWADLAVWILASIFVFAVLVIVTGTMNKFKSATSLNGQKE